MYFVTVRREFSADIQLTPSEPRAGANLRHHDYILEVRAEGQDTDESGFLINITRLESIVDGLLEPWKGALLNDLPDFRGENPTLETVARVACNGIAEQFVTKRIDTIQVTLWESEMEPYPGPSAGYSKRL